MSTEQRTARAVFLDPNGVLAELVDRGRGFFLGGKLVRWTAPFNRHEIRVKPGVDMALSLIRAKGYLAIMTANQPDAATGNTSPAEFAAMVDYYRYLPLDAIYTCPHHPDEGCACRKPAPGMIIRARDEHGLRLKPSFMIGASETDVQTGRASRLHTILVTPLVYTTTGAERRVMSLMEAAEIIPRLS